ncbi:hypothetical protein Tco_0208946 [Tanacetum coccineum]
MNMVVYQMDVKTAFLNGSVDPTLFIRREGKELLLVQIYVDDIIFAASTPEPCDLFAKIMCSKFKMSMMGKKDLSVSKRNRTSGSLVSEGFFLCTNSICRCYCVVWLLCSSPLDEITTYRLWL